MVNFRGFRIVRAKENHEVGKQEEKKQLVPIKLRFSTLVSLEKNKLTEQFTITTEKNQ